ncbi:hypothetical protein [Methylocystis sp. ATCC 49242]|uniref:hypothetical protein n=1 Tax=Methylocystis sp. ATCC 49242 TaxID=622637 RepID=UPI0001F8786E|nr:hypothetical protein [Methylocystis sp. ATCC 49242]
MLKALHEAKNMIADRGNGGDWFHEARGTEPCAPPTKNRTKPLNYDKELNCQRHKIENLIAKLKDWRRIDARLPVRSAGAGGGVDPAGRASRRFSPRGRHSR